MSKESKSIISTLTTYGMNQTNWSIPACKVVIMEMYTDWKRFWVEFQSNSEDIFYALPE